MGLTVTNTNTMQLLTIVGGTQKQQANTLTQLSTGYKINKGSDDPAGLIASESLKASITATSGAIDNAERANSILGVADNAIGEIGSLLSEVEGLVMKASSETGITAAERAANQSQIDAALDSINRITRTTSFNGTRLIDGSLGIYTSGVTTADINNLRIFSRGTSTSDVTMTVQVTASAHQASAAFNAGTGTVASTQKLSGDLELEVTGTDGSKTIFVASGSTIGNMLTEINQATGETGVTATIDNGDLVMKTSGYGSDEYVSVTVLQGGKTDTANVDVGNASRVAGTDATVLVNGQKTNVDGVDVYFSSNGTSGSFSMQSAFNTLGTTSFTVSSSIGGATFQLGTESSTTATIGIDSLATHKLGGGDSGGFLNEIRSGGDYDLNTDSSTALKIVKKAINDVSGARGRIGGFQKYTVQTTINSLEATNVGLTEAKSVISDTDYAVATAELNRQSVLLNSGIQLLGLANQQSSQILALLG